MQPMHFDSLRTTGPEGSLVMAETGQAPTQAGFSQCMQDQWRYLRCSRFLESARRLITIQFWAERSVSRSVMSSSRSTLSPFHRLQADMHLFQPIHLIESTSLAYRRVSPLAGLTGPKAAYTGAPARRFNKRLKNPRLPIFFVTFMVS